MSADEKRVSGTASGGLDEQRRMILKATLGGAAFAVPLLSSFSLEGLSLGSEALAQVFSCNQTFGSNMTNPGSPGQYRATASVDDDGSLRIRLEVDLRFCRGYTVTASANVQGIYACKNGEETPYEDTLEKTYDIPDGGIAVPVYESQVNQLPVKEILVDQVPVNQIVLLLEPQSSCERRPEMSRLKQIRYSRIRLVLGSDLPSKPLFVPVTPNELAVVF